jgi:hypothetical protein
MKMRNGGVIIDINPLDMSGYIKAGFVEIKEEASEDEAALDSSSSSLDPAEVEPSSLVVDNKVKPLRRGEKVSKKAVK